MEPSTLNYSSGNLYYRLSGKYPISGLLGAMGMGLVAALIMAPIYAYIDVYNPIGGWISLIITGGTGFLLGKVFSTGLKKAKVRNVGMAMLVATICALALYVMAWEVWIFALLQRQNAPVGFMDLLTHPAAVWEIICIANSQGVWSMNGTKPSGIALDLFWLIEASLLIGVPLWQVHKGVTAGPFCETCMKWCGTREVARINAGDAAAAKKAFESKQFDIISSLGLADKRATRFWRVYFQGCAECDTTQTLCVDAVTITIDKKGKAQAKAAPLVRRLILTPEDVVAVATAVATIPTAASE